MIHMQPQPPVNGPTRTGRQRARRAVSRTVRYAAEVQAAADGAARPPRCNASPSDGWAEPSRRCLHTAPSRSSCRDAANSLIWRRRPGPEHEVVVGRASDVCARSASLRNRGEGAAVGRQRESPDDVLRCRRSCLVRRQADLDDLGSVKHTSRHGPSPTNGAGADDSRTIDPGHRPMSQHRLAGEVADRRTRSVIDVCHWSSTAHGAPVRRQIERFEVPAAG